MNTIDEVWSGMYAKSYDHAKALAQAGANRTHRNWSVIRDVQGRFYVTSLDSSWSLFTATPQDVRMCEYCHTAHTVGETSSNQTWQQWQCLACGSWNDRKLAGRDEQGYDRVIGATRRSLGK